MKRFLSRPFWLVPAALTVLAGASAPVLADPPVDLDSAPPELSIGVEPNIVVTLDDSGSMSMNHMPDAVSAEWGKQAYHYSGTNSIYYNPATVYQPPLMPDGVTRFPDSSYTNAWRDGICANLPASGDYGARCAPVNRINLSTAFFSGYDSSGCLQLGAGGTCAQLATNQSAYANSNERSWRDIPAGARTRANNTLVTGGFYYTQGATGLVLNEVNNLSETQKQNFANWFSYYRTRRMMAVSSLSSAFAELKNPLRIAWQNINQNPIGDDTTIVSFAAAQKVGFFRWLYATPARNGTPNRSAMIRAGEFLGSRLTNGNANGPTNPYWQPVAGAPNGGLELSCRQNFHLHVTDGFWNSDSPSATARNPITAATLPDGKRYTPNTADTRVYSGQTTAAAPGTANSGNANPSLSDVGFNYWATDLKPNLANKVPRYLGDSRIGVTNATTRPIPLDPFTDDEIYFNPANNPATWQHVVQYTIGLGVPGVLPGGNETTMASTITSLRRGTLQWFLARTDTDDIRKLDDTWRAAVNSRGNFFSVTNPQQLIDSIGKVLRSATGNRSGTSSTPTLSVPVLTGGGAAFGTGYSSAGWTGMLSRNAVSPAGVIGARVWEAGALLTAMAPTARKIATSHGGFRSGQPFQPGNLSVEQQAVLNKYPFTPSGSVTQVENPANWPVDNLASQRVAYIRGDRSGETAAPNFRQRQSLLGAIIYSQPLYVSSPGGFADDFPAGTPEFNAGRTAYEAFVADNSNPTVRPPTVYVGSNDGMLHAFNAADGKERWAFIPNTIILNGRLSRSTIATPELVPGADDKPISSDVFMDGAWKTVLIGSLRLGGRGIYALDITRPTATDEAAVAQKVLWEFSNTSPGGANLGYTYGSANIVRLNNGIWGVLVASGYFPKEGLDSDDPAATRKRSSLFVLDIRDGSVIREIQTPAGVTSYGLSTPAAFDRDLNRSTDVAMAGDLAGNLWRYDLSSADPRQWKVEHFFASYDNDADIGKRPISVMPVAMEDRATRVASNGRVVRPIWVFGTGKYLGSEDRTLDIPTQYFYGVRDYGSGGAGYPLRPAGLAEQTFVDTGDVREANAAVAVPESANGWKMPLTRGERNIVTATPLYVSNIALLATFMPDPRSDPCEIGNRGYVMAVRPDVGSASGQIEGAGPNGGALLGRLTTTPPIGEVPAASVIGGGSVVTPGLGGMVLRVQYWRRSAWREIFNSPDQQ